MPKNRIGFSSDFVLNNSKVGIGTTNPTATLHVAGVLKGDFHITGVATLTQYAGFVPQKQNISVASTIGFTTTGIGTVGITSFVAVNERETGFVSLIGEFNTLSEDLIVDDGKIFDISTVQNIGITTIGTQSIYVPNNSTVSAGTLKNVTVASHFSVPHGGISSRTDSPTEGMVRFNTDLNTLEFWNGFEWRQFTVTGASGRGVFGGGASGPAYSQTIDFINISSQGNALNFGVLLSARSNIASCSSSIRGIFAGGAGSGSPGYINTVEYVTIASEGNSISFGTLSTTNRAYAAGCSSSTRGLFGGGYTTSPANAVVNVIDYIQFSTLGNAVDFGDLFTGRYALASFSSPTRAIWGGGSAPSGNSPSNLIDFVTISSTGNAVSFGTLTTKRWAVAGCSNSVRGLFAGGGISQPLSINLIDYITIASTGNASYFGDLTEAKNRTGGCATQIRGVFGGNAPSTNTIEYVTIASTGNAINFGQLTFGRFTHGACSDSHGGLGGF